MRRWTLLPCLIVLHSPDGGTLQVEASSVYAMRAATGNVQEHVAKGTNTILYVGGKVFGVTETPQEIAALMESCGP